MKTLNPVFNQLNSNNFHRIYAIMTALGIVILNSIGDTKLMIWAWHIEQQKTNAGRMIKMTINSASPQEYWLNVLETIDRHLEQHPDAVIVNRSMTGLGDAFVPKYSSSDGGACFRYALAPTKPNINWFLRLWQLNGLLHSLVPDELIGMTFDGHHGRKYHEDGEKILLEISPFRYETKAGEKVKWMHFGKVWFRNMDIGDVVTKRRAEQRAVINTESIQSEGLKKVINDFCEPAYYSEDSGKGVLELSIELDLYPSQRF